MTPCSPSSGIWWVITQLAVSMLADLLHQPTFFHVNYLESWPFTFCFLNQHWYSFDKLSQFWDAISLHLGSLVASWCALPKWQVWRLCSYNSPFIYLMHRRNMLQRWHLCPLPSFNLWILSTELFKPVLISLAAHASMLYHY